MKTRLEVGMTFRTKGGLELYVEERNGALYTCVHRGTNWRGWYHVSGGYSHADHDADPNLHAEFYEE